MSNLFEDLMMQQGQSLTESFRKSRQKKTESVNPDCPKIKSNRIRVESLGVFETAEDPEALDTEFNKDPLSDDEAEVVLVVDPDLSIEEEIPEDAAEQMIGDRIYKCPVCGSNYACGCDEEGNFTESVDLDEDGVPTECPICNSDADQILVGEIVTLDEAEAVGEDPGEFDPVDADDNEDDIPEDDSDLTDLDDEDDGKFEESKKPLRTGKTRQESVQVEVSDDEVKVEVDADDDAEASALDDNECILDVACDDEDCSLAEYEDDDEEVYQFDDVKFESLMNKFLKENYKGSPRFKLESVIHSGNSLKLEYVLTVGNKSRKGVLVAEGYTTESRVLRMNARDHGGQFTESVTRKPAFKFECVNIGKKIIPTKVTYDFKRKVNESVYRVYGTVDSKKKKQVSESSCRCSKSLIKESNNPYEDEASNIINYYDNGRHGGLVEAIDSSIEEVLNSIESLPWDDDKEVFKCTREELSDAYDSFGTSTEWLKHYGLSDREADIVNKYVKQDFINTYLG